MPVRVRRPLFETALDLPAEPIESGHQVEREGRAWQVGAQPRHGRLAARQDHDADAHDAGPDREVPVEVQALADVLGEEARHPEARRHGGALALDPGGSNRRVVAARETHNERAAVRGRRELPWTRARQGGLEGERRPVVDHNVGESRDGRLAIRRERLDTDLVEHPRQHPAHERREPAPGKPVVEGLVGDGHPVLVVTRAEQIGERSPQSVTQLGTLGGRQDW